MKIKIIIMKTKDDSWYQDKINDIKERNRKLRHIEDPKMRKKIKRELKNEQRAAKRSNKQHVRKWIDDQIYGS